MTELVTNFSYSPYFDDYDENKKFVRILFKPAMAVQTRELNQFQTIIQNQISRFSNHVFKDGSVVEGVAITYNSKQDYVHVKNSFDNHPNTALDEIPLGGVITNAFGVRAIPRVIKRGFEVLYPQTNRIYLDYIRTGKDGANNDVRTFASGETLTIYNSNQSKLGALNPANIYDTIGVMSANSTVTPTGVGYSISVSDGIVYQKGYYSKVSPQTTLVREFDTTTTNMVVGFETQEIIVNSDQDESLLDNSNGSTNSNAPGADRLKLNPVLVAYDKTSLPENSNFFPIVEFNDKEAVEQHTDPVYNRLGDQIATRTKEESGDYVVKPFAIETLEDANSALMYYQVSPGIGYVNGYRVELISSNGVIVPRATTKEEANAQIVTGNYGSYVLVNELSGTFDINNIGSVTIYDATQNTLTDIEAVSSAPSGNAIGTANIRSIMYNSGTKGTPDATYRLYIFNISMNPGKSFSNDAKSIYGSSSYGKAKGDLILESGKAVIKDSDNDKLVFPFGITPIRRLTNSAGVNDTQFIFRDIASSTLQSNGFVTFTLSSPYAGGNERLNNSVGVISDNSENDYNITLSTAAYSANQAGTVSVSGTTMTGVGTSFNTLFAVNDFVRFPATGDLRRITAIANSTSLTLSATTTASGATYQRYWPEGYMIDLSGNAGSIAVVSNTQFSVSTDIITTGGSGSQLAYVSYPVLRTDAVGIKKDIKKDRFVKIDCSTNTKGPWNLGLVDVINISGVYLGTGANNYADTNPDKKNYFALDNGQRDGIYDHAKLILNPAYADQIDSNTKLLVKLDHFVANTSAGAGFFSVDSYPFIDAGASANSTNISIGAVPTYKGQDVRGIVDFRPQRFNTANSATTISGASINPAGPNSSFATVSTGSYIIQPDSNFEADIEYYLPRVDVVSITKDGSITVAYGTASNEPRTPQSENDSLDIAKITVPAYPSLTTREGHLYNRQDLSSTINLISNKRYTMRDIGVLDQRIKRLEYYTALTSLEQSAKDMTIPDENGLDRFKNGIFADPFKSHAYGDVGNFEYKISIDSKNSIARPYFEKTAIDYQLDPSASSNYAVTGPKVSLPYAVTEYIYQSYATKYRNCAENVWKWNGDLTLYPAYDHFRDETALPAVNVSIDLAKPFEDFANSPFATNFGDWRTVNTAVSSSNTSVTSGRTTTKTTTTTTTTKQSRDVQILDVDVTNETYSFGSAITDISINPFMRSREVAFVAHGLKPNSRVYPYFDGVNVAAHCAPGVLSGDAFVSTGQENRVVNRTGDYGTQLVTDSIGSIVGMFRIPAATFRVGDRRMMIANVDDLVTGNSAIITSASAVYTASSMSVSTQESTLSTRNPTVTTVNRTDTQTIVDVSVNKTVTTTSPPSPPVSPTPTPTVTTPPKTPTTPTSPPPTPSPKPPTVVIPTGTPPPPPPPPTITVNPRFFNTEPGGHGDPLAQSFLVTTPNDVTGMYFRGLGVFFKSKDPSLGVTAYLMEMNYNYPNVAKTLGKKHLTSAEVNVSDNSDYETVFDFDDIIYLSKDSYYAFMIKPDGDSPEYTIWTCEVGGIDVIEEKQVFSSPYIGTLFTSSNSDTWTAVQSEDLKFKVYRAEFTSATGTVVFNNEDDEYLQISGITKANSSLSVQVGDIVRAANTTGGLLVGNNDPVGWVQEIDESNNKLILDTSNGKFVSGQTLKIHREFMNGQTTLNANTLVGTTTISQIVPQTYSMIVPRFAHIKPAGTNVSFHHYGIDTLRQIDDRQYNVTPETENERTDKMRMILSRSDEVALYNGAKTSTYTLQMSTVSSYVSPIIDLGRKSSLIIRNIINNDNTNEHTRYGNALSKYVSAPITLADGQDAEDMIVYLTAYRPVTTDIEVYVKFRNVEDNETIDNKVWTKLDGGGSNRVYSSSVSPNDFREYMFTIPANAPVTNAAFKNALNNDIVQYTRADGSVFISYKEFSIKVVLLAENAALIPKLDDLRAICLQV